MKRERGRTEGHREKLRNIQREMLKYSVFSLFLAFSVFNLYLDIFTSLMQQIPTF